MRFPDLQRRLLDALKRLRHKRLRERYPLYGEQRPSFVLRRLGRHVDHRGMAQCRLPAIAALFVSHPAAEQHTADVGYLPLKYFRVTVPKLDNIAAATGTDVEGCAFAWWADAANPEQVLTRFERRPRRIALQQFDKARGSAHRSIAEIFSTRLLEQDAYFWSPKHLRQPLGCD
jgi:hypothetical protein